MTETGDRVEVLLPGFFVFWVGVCSVVSLVRRVYCNVESAAPTAEAKRGAWLMGLFSRQRM